MLLVRFAYLPTGVLGRLHSEEGQVQLYTLERAWLGNQPFVSCVPEGDYRLAPWQGRKWKGVLELTSVPGRTAILLHPATVAAELAGCIAPGFGWQIDRSTPSLTQSREALQVVMDWFTNGDETLTIASERSRSLGELG